jgi:hypothetical protein
VGESTDLSEGSAEGTKGCGTEHRQDAEEKDGEEEEVGKEESLFPF